MLRELKAHEFDERLAPIFEEVQADAGHAGALNSDFFFPHWQHLMELGIARTWEVPGAVLGALFVNDTFRGTPTALSVFWVSTKAARKGGECLKLLGAFEAAAREKKCTRMLMTAHCDANYKAMQRMFKRRGFKPLELEVQKELIYG